MWTNLLTTAQQHTRGSHSLKLATISTWTDGYSAVLFLSKNYHRLKLTKQKQCFGTISLFLQGEALWTPASILSDLYSSSICACWSICVEAELPNVIAWQHCGWELNSWPISCKSNAITTKLLMLIALCLRQTDKATTKSKHQVL